MDKKMYGLVLPKTKSTQKPVSKSIFDSDSDDDINQSRTKRDPPVKLSKTESKYMEEDPSIYEYDSIYDSMKESPTKKQTVSVERKPKFMSSLLKAAEKRKKDQERRVEKKIHKDRIKEGDEFKDKDAFVTSAYKKKMQEMEDEEERERRKDKLEDMMDVTKQKDLSGFYRHLLNQTTGEEKVPIFGETDKAVAKSSKPATSSAAAYREESDEQSGTSSSEEDTKPLKEEKRRTSRQSASSNNASLQNRHDSESSKDSYSAHENPDQEMEEGLKRKLTTAGESDNKSRKVSSSQKSSNEESRSLFESSSTALPQVDCDTNLDADDDIVDSDSEKSDVEDKTEQKTEISVVEANDDEQKPEKTVLKTDMSFKFVKRTVGEVFKQAQERYFKRMAARDAAKKL